MADCGMVFKPVMNKEAAPGSSQGAEIDNGPDQFEFPSQTRAEMDRAGQAAVDSSNKAPVVSSSIV